MSLKEVSIIENILNILGLLAVSLVLFMALGLQFISSELPCPLCLLQRIGFFGIALGFLLNLRFGLRPSHYAVVLLSAVFTSAVALRQVALHVVPGTGAYGNPFLGMHLYSWCFVLAMIIVLVTTLMMGIDAQYFAPQAKSRQFRRTVNLLFLILTIALVANLLSVFLQCGLSACPDNPETYQVLNA